MPFPKILPHIFREEGGYVDHPRDPGGATNMGITHKTLAAHRGHSVTKQDVRNLSRNEAGHIYRKNYWNKVNGDNVDDISPAIAYVLMDCAVNRGTSRAAKTLQKCLGVKVDGDIGNKTITALERCLNRHSLLAKFLARRMFNYGNLTSLFRTFGLGWARRLMRVALIAGEMMGSEK